MIIRILSRRLEVLIQKRLTMLFEIYNDVTGETKAKTRCGRCIANTVKTVKWYYEKAEK